MTKEEIDKAYGDIATALGPFVEDHSSITICPYRGIETEKENIGWILNDLETGIEDLQKTIKDLRNRGF